MTKQLIIDILGLLERLLFVVIAFSVAVFAHKKAKELRTQEKAASTEAGIEVMPHI